MRLSKSLQVLAVVVALGLGLALVATAAGSDGSAEVTYLKGKAFVTHDKATKAQLLKKGDPVGPGDLIETSKKSRIEIRLADNSAIRLGSKSRLVLKQALFPSKTQKNVSATLLRGQAYAAVSKLVGKDSTFEVKTRTAVAGVRGTAFRINALKDKSTVVRVYTGAVAVSNAPLYAKAGKPKASSGKFQMPRQGVKPGGPGRVVVAGPSQVTKKEWETIVAKAMQEVVVGANGKISSSAFAGEPKEEEEWVAWNQEMDKKAGH